jgi:hypothetical protein
MKKFLLLILTISTAWLLIGCSQDNEVTLETDDQLFTLQALSSTTLLNYNQLSVTQTSLPLANDEIPEPEIAKELKDIDYYVEMMDLFLGQENLTVVSETSDNEDYEFMTTYSTTSLSGEEALYVFYYNEYELEENETLAPEDQTTESPDDKPFRFHDEDDEFVAMGIEGVLILGETTYNIEGKKIINSQKEIYRLRSFIDESNYVLVNYQTDVDDQDKEKFFFRLVENDVVISESKIMMFSRDNRLHLKLEFTEGELYESYLFNIRTEDDTKYIFIKYDIQNGEENETGVVRLTAQTDPDTGEIIYDYAMKPDNGRKEIRETFRHRRDTGEKPMIGNR